MQILLQRRFKKPQSPAFTCVLRQSRLCKSERVPLARLVEEPEAKSLDTVKNVKARWGTSVLERDGLQEHLDPTVVQLLSIFNSLTGTCERRGQQCGQLGASYLWFKSMHWFSVSSLVDESAALGGDEGAAYLATLKTVRASAASNSLILDSGPLYIHCSMQNK